MHESIGQDATNSQRFCVIVVDKKKKKKHVPTTKQESFAKKGSEQRSIWPWAARFRQPITRTIESAKSKRPPLWRLHPILNNLQPQNRSRMVFVRTLFLKDTRLVYLDCNSLEDCRNALTARSGVPPDQLIFYKVSFTSSFQAFCFKNSGFSKADGN